MTKLKAFDYYGNDGTFPYTCTTCGVICDTIDELADPDHHEPR